MFSVKVPNLEVARLVLLHLNELGFKYVKIAESAVTMTFVTVKEIDGLVTISQKRKSITSKQLETIVNNLTMRC